MSFNTRSDTPLHSLVLAPPPASGRALVLLHAFPLDHRMWIPAASQIAASLASDEQEWGVVAIDLPGLGASSAPAGDASLTVSAELVLETLSGLGIAQIVVAGVSMGGYVALELARTAPDVVVGLALLDTKDTADTPEARANRLRVADEVLETGSVAAVTGMGSAQLAPEHRKDESMVALVTSWISEQQAAGVAWSQRAMASRGDYLGVTTDFRRPSVVVIGEYDEFSPVAGGRAMADRLAAARFEVIAHAGHLAAYEQPAAVAEVLVGLLQRVQSEGASQ